jgi:hypothetical protein
LLDLACRTGRGYLYHPEILEISALSFRGQEMHQIVKTFLRPDQQRRVRIYQRDDGLFSFDESVRISSSDEGAWGPLAPYASFCDTAEAAEREALATIPWMQGAQIAD